ncbi:vWA domain-containing protein [Thiocystis violascens]|uniref:Mg-chelatase subunit ChlD n=1 Tax=Thiocystis violascens (strain ATCC 17096 / DSM 198 / 6111) TaxID=765911 RepID=I3YH31_THIV6|nr:vWA domain-containing protein [Thiocystis violascens]AFL76299.1 Mg-chelatase subunit ChlD [Thiocystis violascens DSM 198]
MTCKPVAVRLNLLALLAILTCMPAEAVDVVLTLDRSLSMKANDPNRDSTKGAELFGELLGAEDRLALTTFAQESERLLALTPLSGTGTRERVSSLIKQVRMDGIRTNFEAALRTAYRLYPDQPPDPANERVLVLFSDGQLNLGNEDANQTSRAAVIKEIIPKFQAAGIRILGVAFSPEADLAFLRRLADATGGQAFRADKPADIYDAFVRLFEQTDQPLTAPVIDGEVKVDANVRELKLLVKRDTGDGPMQLTDPSGRTFGVDEQTPGVDWKSTPYFDRISIQQPEAGSWKVTSDNADKKAYIESDLDLHATLPVLASLDETVTVVAKLLYRGVAVDPSLMKNTRFTATSLDASGVIQQQLELQPGASDPTARNYRGTFAFSTPGLFQVRVSAEGVDFQRQKTYFLTILGTEQPESANAQAGAGSPDNATDADSPDSDPSNQRAAFFMLLLGNLGLLALAGVGVGVWWWRRRGRIEPDEVDPDD